MAFTINYSILFKVDILHHYFLNKGDNEFSVMSDDERQKQLQHYLTGAYFKIRPSSQTAAILAGHKLVFRTTQTGFIVLALIDRAKPVQTLDKDLDLTFMMHLSDPFFYSYTDLELENSGKIFYFSNHRLSSEPGTFPLIKMSGSSDLVSSDYVLKEESVSTVKKALTVSETPGLFGLVTLRVKGDTGSHNLLNLSGEITDPPRHFQITFGNRKTFWRYLYDKDQTVSPADDVKLENADPKILITKSTLPLTFNGFIVVEKSGIQLPNPELLAFKPDTDSNMFYSEIYM